MINHQFIRKNETLESISKAYFELDFYTSEGSNQFAEAQIELKPTIAQGELLSILNLHFTAGESNELPQTFNRLEPALGIIKHLKTSFLAAHFQFSWVNVSTIKLKARNYGYNELLQNPSFIYGEALAQFTILNNGDAQHSFFHQTVNSALLRVKVAPHNLGSMAPHSFQESQVELSHLLQVNRLKEKFHLKDLLPTVHSEQKEYALLQELNEQMEDAGFNVQNANNHSIAFPAYTLEVQLENAHKSIYPTFETFQQSDAQTWLLNPSPFHLPSDCLRDENNVFEVPFVNYHNPKFGATIPYLIDNAQQQPLLLEFIQLNKLEIEAENEIAWKLLLQTFDRDANFLLNTELLTLNGKSAGLQRLSIPYALIKPQLGNDVSSFNFLIEDELNKVLFSSPSFTCWRLSPKPKGVLNLLYQPKNGIFQQIALPIESIQEGQHSTLIHSTWVDSNFVSAYMCAFRSLQAISLQANTAYLPIEKVDVQLSHIENKNYTQFQLNIATKGNES